MKFIISFPPNDINHDSNDKKAKSFNGFVKNLIHDTKCLLKSSIQRELRNRKHIPNNIHGKTTLKTKDGYVIPTL